MPSVPNSPLVSQTVWITNENELYTLTRQQVQEGDIVMTRIGRKGWLVVDNDNVGNVNGFKALEPPIDESALEQILPAAAADATTKANAAQAAAIAAAAADATAKANTAQAAAILAAADDATTKANAARTAAESYADGLLNSAASSVLRMTSGDAGLLTLVQSGAKVVHMSGSGWAASRANSSTTLRSQSFFVESYNASLVTLVGAGVATVTGGTAGQQMFVSEATAGAMVSSISGFAKTSYVQAVGTYLSATQFLVGFTDPVTLSDLTVSRGGTGQSTFTDGQLLIGKSDGTLAKATLTAGSNITITNADGAITISGTGGGGGVLSVLLAYGEVASNLSATTNFIGGSTGYRKGAQVDATNFTQARLLCTRDASAAATGSRMALRYVATGSNAYMTPGNYVAAGTTEIELNLETTSNTIATPWVNLAAGAKGDRYFAPITYGGDGVADPSLGNVYVQFK